MKQAFGQFLKAKRLALDLSLREFARRVGMQPSNYCNVEAGVLLPPPSEGLERIALALGLKRGTKEFETFHDLAQTLQQLVEIGRRSAFRAHAKIP